MDYLASDITTHVLLALSGISAGFINTLAGGGGLIIFPVLMLLGMPADLANGTYRLGVVTQCGAGAWRFRRAGKLPKQGAIQVIAPAIVGGIAGALVATGVSAATLRTTLLIAMPVMTLAIALMPRPRVGQATNLSATRRWLGIAALAGAGFYGGFIQAGAGFLFIITLLGVLRYDLVETNALKLFAIFIFSTFAFVILAVAGQVAWDVAVLLSVYTVIGSQLGVRFALNVPQVVLRWLLVVTVAGASVAVYLRGN